MNNEQLAGFRRMAEHYKVALPADADLKAIKEGLKGTDAYKALFSKMQNETAALKAMKDVPVVKDVAAWVVNPWREKVYRGESQGFGVDVLFTDGGISFLKYEKAPIPPTTEPGSPLLFAGARGVRDLFFNKEDVKVRGITPVQKEHGVPMPTVDLTKDLDYLYKFNDKQGRINGETFDKVFASLRIGEAEGDIKFFEARREGQDPTLTVYAYYQSAGASKKVAVECDPIAISEQTGIDVSASRDAWVRALRGQPLLAYGKASVLYEKWHGFFEADRDHPTGVLAGVAAELLALGGLKRDKKGNLRMSLTGLKDPQSGEQMQAFPCGDYWLYDLRERKNGETGESIWTGYLRHDLIVSKFDPEGLPPRIDTKVKRGQKNDGSGAYAINEGAFVKLLGYGKNATFADDDPFKQMTLEA